ncbi:hypothetical protein I79_022456 [Cricetulus griseus]|uniref:Uncharacterized protein n=1 Tax=Cricetulus griseus TaxID=10029 RepID=G3IFD4_CRIGR|nr:hypothetical protein I79_022456 [Cricetulus griseus]
MLEKSLKHMCEGKEPQLPPPSRAEPCIGGASACALSDIVGDEASTACMNRQQIGSGLQSLKVSFPWRQPRLHKPQWHLTTSRPLAHDANRCPSGPSATTSPRCGRRTQVAPGAY